VPSVAVLPSAVADQIAAGEVVERPASAVKELVENALDAGATVVDVDVEEGGRSSIRVSDDGSGLARDDALLALERHATSKIRRVEDLVGVTSFGFRGEALPAIASVSRLTLETAAADGSGTVVFVEGGALADVRDAARRRGTTVSVSRLFYNVPARLKFMRSARSEWRAVSDVITAIALARRGTHLTLTHDGKRALTLPGVESLRARIGALWGGPYADGLVEVDDVLGEVAVSGLIERPGDVGVRTRRVHLAINGRVVRDTGLLRAAESAYRSSLPAGFRPSVVLDVTVSPDSVDVNVHPAKAEVRFRDRWAVERAVEHAVRRALGNLDSAATLGAGIAPRWASGGMAHVWTPLTSGAGLKDGHTSVEHVRTTGAWPTTELATEDGVGAVPRLTQLRRTYIMFERPDGVALIDQHSAHERVLYESFMAALTTGGAPSQRLLFPLTLHLGAAGAEAYEEHRDSFERLGFEAEAFGGQTLLVHAVPAPHPRFDAEHCLRDTLGSLTGDRLAGNAARHEHLAATVACKAAIKAGDELGPGEMQALYVALTRTTLPAHDVHGRSTIVLLSWDEVERRFGRR